MSRPSIDFKRLNDLLLAHAYRLIVEFCPGGKQRHREYVAGSIYGGEGSSFSFNLDTGKWSDFAVSDHKGGDMISLYAKINNLSQIDAAKKLCEMVDYKPNYSPETATLPKNIHPIHGKATGYWIYKNRQGVPTHVVMRFDPDGERKQFSQWHYDSDTNKWIPRATKTVPLFNLNDIASEPNKIIAVCEGEKAAEAAQKILGTKHYITTCWPGGSNAVRKVDLSPLFERDVLLWPDADEPGQKCMNYVAKEIASLAKKIKIIQNKPEDKKGMDAADMIGLPIPEAISWLKNRIVQLKPFVGGLEEDQLKTGSGLIPLRESVVQDQPSSSSSLTPTSNNLKAINTLDLDSQMSVVDEFRMMDLWISAGLQMTKANKPFETELNVLKILNYDKLFQNKFYYDEFYCRYFSTFDSTEPMELDDLVLTKIKIYLQGYYGLNKLTTKAIEMSLSLFLKQQPRRNTIQEKFSTYKWDKIPRIDKFFHEIYGAPDTEYTSAVSRIFWLSLMKRACKPGIKVDTVIILEGKQGIKKSTSLELIAGKQYATAGRDMTNKDFYLKMNAKTLLEIAELNSFSKHDHNELKEMVSTATDEYRIPYGTRVEAHPRTCIFVGTTNERNYLKDDTGSRRYLPIDCQKVEWELLQERLDQYYAEAYERGINQDEDHWSYPVEIHKLITSKRDADDKDIDGWYDQIQDFVFDVQTVYVTDICTYLNIPTHLQSDRIFKRVSKIMKKLGFEKTSTKQSSKTRRCYINTNVLNITYMDSQEKFSQSRNLGEARTHIQGAF